MSDTFPGWAMEEVDKRVPPPPPTSTPTAATDAWQWKAYADHLRHFAAILIAKHEDPPVDPLLIEAREMAANYYDAGGNHSAADKCRSSEWDHTAAVQWRIEALRRGIEIAEGRKHD